MIRKLPERHCERCGHSWVPRKIRCVACPKCNSPYWDKPRKIKPEVPKE